MGYVQGLLVVEAFEVNLDACSQRDTGMGGFVFSPDFRSGSMRILNM